jgi:hypothetical protein
MGRHQLGAELLDHDLSAEQRLQDDEDARHQGSDKERAIAASCAEERDQPHRGDQWPHRERCHQAVAVLDPGVQLSGWNPLAEARRPIRAAQA